MIILQAEVMAIMVFAQETIRGSYDNSRILIMTDREVVLTVFKSVAI